MTMRAVHLRLPVGLAAALDAAATAEASHLQAGDALPWSAHFQSVVMSVTAAARPTSPGRCPSRRSGIHRTLDRRGRPSHGSDDPTRPIPPGSRKY